MNRFTITISGQSGSGLLTSGEILLNSFKNLGFHIHAERFFPSLIKGGHSSYQINISDKQIHSLSKTSKVVVALDKEGVKNYVNIIKQNGLLIHGLNENSFPKEVNEILQGKSITTISLDALKSAKECGGNHLVSNMIILGMTWKVLNLDYEILKNSVEKKFKSKPDLLEIDLKCVERGHVKTITNYELRMTDELNPVIAKSKAIKQSRDNSVQKIMGLQRPTKCGTRNDNKNSILIDGNTSIALGAIHAGVRVYYAYPMSPASSILTYIAKTCHETGIIVKQVEDEISTVQMTIGSMFMGTRSFTATSGGGFDLMTESISLSGMIESPLVIVLAQRAGPGTGLPTWTGQGDLNLAIYSAHGEFSKIVLSCSDPTSCFELIQKAFNLSEKFQVPVIVLTEKTICESKMTVPTFKNRGIEIERGLMNDKEINNLDHNNRFEITKDGVSKRWLPGSSKYTYFANGDEHRIDGTVTEDSDEVIASVNKRMKKLETIKKNLPDPIVYGEDKADISFVGFGSSKNVMQDIIAIYKGKNISVNYLHFDYVWPLKTERLQDFFKENENVYLIEGNYTGQLGQLIENKTDYCFKDKLLKYDGRPFYIEDVTLFIDKINK